jgi:hypothetical protein
MRFHRDTFFAVRRTLHVGGAASYARSCDGTVMPESRFVRVRIKHAPHALTKVTCAVIGYWLPSTTAAVRLASAALRETALPTGRREPR